MWAFGVFAKIDLKKLIGRFKGCLRAVKCQREHPAQNDSAVQPTKNRRPARRLLRQFVTGHPFSARTPQSRIGSGDALRIRGTIDGTWPDAA